MTTITPFTLLPNWRTMRRLLPLLIASSGLVYAQSPGQLPLLSKSGPAVPPNIMLILDDSGSMAFRHMPEDVFAGDTFSTTNPVGSQSVRWDPSDNYQWSTNTTDTVPGDIASTNYRLRALRSADTNSMYYSPEIRYQPWLANDGVTRLPNSPANAAYLSPPIVRSTTTTSLTVATGSKLLTLVQAGLSFSVGSTALISSVASPSTTWMYGSITAYNSGTGSLTINVTKTFGSGTASNWNVVQTPNAIVDLTAVTPNGTFTAGNFLVGSTYTIVKKGTTSFTAIGAANNNVGTVFTATGVGTGTGTASAGTSSGWCYANATTSCTNATGPFNHDPGVYFRLTKTNGVYNAITTAANYTAFTINASAGTTFTKYPARLDCAGTVCTRDEERQNFANWYTYYRTRNMMARGSMMEAFGPASNTFRLGFGRINNGSGTVDGVTNTKVIESNSIYGGGGVRPFDGTRKVNLFKWLEDLPASGGTPLVEALDTAGKYYSRTDSRGPWTDDPSTTNTVANNKTCRRSYTILTTDGYWNGPGVSVGNADATDGTTITGNGSYTYHATKPYSDGTANTLADVAMYYWKRDLQTATDNKVPPIGTNNSFWQNMTDFTVGLGVRGSLNPATDLPALTSGAKTWPAAASGQTFANVDDLWHAALNSRGQYFSAKDPKELSDAIRSALSTAAGKEGRTAGAATAATTLSSNNRKYVPLYTPGSWDGDIEASALDALGQTTAVQWKASTRVPLPAARNIVTWDPSLNSSVTFNWADLSTSARSELGSVAAANTSDFIDFLRGDHTKEGDGKPFRSRINSAGSPFVLGDFVNGNPVLVKDGFDGVYSSLGLGSGTTTSPTYSQFLTAKAARTSVLYVGSNDGMLHAFKDSKGATPVTDGQEVFAYVPRTVYPNLYKLTDKSYGSAGALEHQFFVDGPLDEADAFVPAPGASTPTWRNYLVGSLGAGGKAVFALDVTDPSSLGTNTVRWEISGTTESDLGYVMAPMRVGVLPNGRWVAIFGNGYSSSSGKATLFVVDLEYAANGNSGAIKKLYVDSSSGNGLGGATLIHDTSGYITTVYVGDLNGNMWKLNYSASAASGFVVDGGVALFSASVGATVQPVISSPAVYNHAAGGKVVIFGTGSLFSDADASTTSTQSVYAVWDKTADSATRPLHRSDLAIRSLSSFTGANNATFFSIAGTAVDWVAQRGWYLDVSTVLPGGRVLYPVQVLGYDTVLVTSVAPVQGTPVACESQFGTGMSLILPVQSGLNSPNHTLDTNGDGIVNGSDSYAVGYKTDAGGVSAIVRSAAGGGNCGVSTNCGGDPTSPPGSVGSGTNDKGGGGEVGDCTGAVCGAAGNSCQYSALCPEENTCLDSIQSAKVGMVVCVPTGVPPGNPNVTPTRQYDRVWRRIIAPPIR